MGRLIKLESIKEKNEMALVEKQGRLIKQQKKWSNFRVERVGVIDKYLKQKRKQLIAESLLKMLYRHNMLLKHRTNYLAESRHRYIKKRNIWLILNVEMLFKRKLRRNRQLGLDLHKSKVRNAFTMVAMGEMKIHEQQSLQILKEFIPIHIGIYPLIKGARKTFRKFELIQKRILDQLSIKFAKVDVLINFWDKTINNLRKLSYDTKDQQILKLVDKIIKVPDHIKKWVLTLYLYACRELAQIAFFQWRKKYPSTVRNERELLDEMLKFRIEYSFGDRMKSIFKAPLP